MTVGELKEVLRNLDDDLEIFMSSDPEGNGYWSLYQWEVTGRDTTYNEPMEPGPESPETLFLWPG